MSATTARKTPVATNDPDATLELEDVRRALNCLSPRSCFWWGLAAFHRTLGARREMFDASVG